MSVLNKLDVLDAEKRLTRVLKSKEGQQALRNLTGLELVFAGDAMPKRDELPIVAVLRPSYRRVPASASVMTMLQAAQSHCQVFTDPCVSTSVVHWSRNYMLASLLKSFKPFDYVLFIDDDIEPHPDSLIRLLSHKVDVVGAACTVRQDPPLPNFRTFDPTNLTYTTCFQWGRDGLIETGAVGTGMMLISHKLLKAVAEYYINCKYEQKFYGLKGEDLETVQTGRQAESKATADFWWFEFLKQPYGKGEWSEDISFCFKCRELGFPIYVDTTVRPRHMGDYGYSLDDYLDTANQEMLHDEVRVGQRTTDQVAAMIEEPSCV